VIWLDAEYELTASDGEKRVIGVGEVVLAEDTIGKGHITKPLGQKLAHGLSYRSTDGGRAGRPRTPRKLVGGDLATT
jgi:hypothetical protein